MKFKCWKCGKVFERREHIDFYLKPGVRYVGCSCGAPNGFIIKSGGMLREPVKCTYPVIVPM